PPVLFRARRQGFTGERFFVEWKSKTQKTTIEITDQNGMAVKTADSNILKWKAGKPGRFLARAYSIDRYGRWSRPSIPVPILVKERAAVLAPLAKVQPETPRDVAAVPEEESASSSVK